MSNILLHNESCSKSNAAYRWLEEQQINFEVRNYIAQPLSYEELVGVLSKLKISALQLVRTNEQPWMEYNYDENSSDEDILKLIVQHPILLQRPIFIMKDAAVIARPIDNLIALFNKSSKK
jgi:arsenate reductase